MRIALIVEDEESLRSYYSAVLDRLGFSVITADDGDTALSLMEKNPCVDLIILDLRMKRMDGEEAYPKMKALSPSSKVIVSSAYVGDEEEKVLKAMGVDAILRKPFKMLTFKDTVINITGSG